MGGVGDRGTAVRGWRRGRFPCQACQITREGTGENGATAGGGVVQTGDGRSDATGLGVDASCAQMTA